jgi:hypothetical protein
METGSLTGTASFFFCGENQRWFGWLENFRNCLIIRFFVPFLRPISNRLYVFSLDK